MKASIFHSFLSSLVIQYKIFTFKQSTAAVRGRKRKELKRKKKKIDKEEEEEEEGKRQVTNGDRKGERERESHLCEAKCFCNCVGDLVVWHINKIFDFSIFLLLYTSKP